MKRRLQIGGDSRPDGWETYGPCPGQHIDYVGELADLSQFHDATFSEILASHVVQHLSYKNDLDAALREWHRILRPGGRVSISTPDLDVLARLIATKDHLAPIDRFRAMQIMFGVTDHPWGFHRVGLNEEFLTSYLIAAGYVNVRRVESFGLLVEQDIVLDPPPLALRGVPVGLNVIAEKPAP